MTANMPDYFWRGHNTMNNLDDNDIWSIIADLKSELNKVRLGMTLLEHSIPPMAEPPEPEPNNCPECGKMPKVLLTRDDMWLCACIFTHPYISNMPSRRAAIEAWNRCFPKEA
jgi:hypothetical protein